MLDSVEKLMEGLTNLVGKFQVSEVVHWVKNEPNDFFKFDA